ncbi:MAG: hypothetical protein KDK66_00765 [Deltaproteobacteria bacterium]|nr:hypothetical protein [Deltaproteobacteria bacterium]
MDLFKGSQGIVGLGLSLEGQVLRLAKMVQEEESYRILQLEEAKEEKWTSSKLQKYFKQWKIPLNSPLAFSLEEGPVHIFRADLKSQDLQEKREVTQSAVKNGIEGDLSEWDWRILDLPREEDEEESSCLIYAMPKEVLCKSKNQVKDFKIKAKIAEPLALSLSAWSLLWSGEAYPFHVILYLSDTQGIWIGIEDEYVIFCKSFLRKDLREDSEAALMEAFSDIKEKFLQDYDADSLEHAKFAGIWTGEEKEAFCSQMGMMVRDLSDGKSPWVLLESDLQDKNIANFSVALGLASYPWRDQ